MQFQFGHFAGNLGATVSVNLREVSITGNVFATTAPVFMSNGYRGTTTFYFNNNVPVAPGVTYYFQPTLISGDDTGVMGDLYDYRGGTLYSQGLATTTPGLDFWFREGIVVPEPSMFSLVGIGAGFLLWGLRRRQ